jgi:hypothetical protein
MVLNLRRHSEYRIFYRSRGTREWCGLLGSRVFDQKTYVANQIGGHKRLLQKTNQASLHHFVGCSCPSESRQQEDPGAVTEIANYVEDLAVTDERHRVSTGNINAVLNPKHRKYKHLF